MLQASGFRIEAHTANHPDLRSLSDAEIEAEMEAADAAIEARLGRRPRFFAYPYGYHDSRVRAVAAEALRRLLHDQARLRRPIRRAGRDPASRRALSPLAATGAAHSPGKRRARLHRASPRASTVARPLMEPKLSIVVAVRDGAANVPALLDALKDRDSDAEVILCCAGPTVSPCGSRRRFRSRPKRLCRPCGARASCAPAAAVLR